MAKISALTSGSTPVGSTDEFPIARSGANRKLSVGSFPIVLAKWGVPVILASSGTMGNNGAVSGMTALPTTYSGGAWLYLPANSIDGSNAAGFYWFVASSTTAGTVYNSTWDGAGVPTDGTATAWVSTGPGAFTGVATGEITAITVTIPANALGPNGYLQFFAEHAINTAAGNKIFRIRYNGIAGTTIRADTVTTTSQSRYTGSIRNVSSAALQRYSAEGFSTGGLLSPSIGYTTADTTAATTLVFTLEKATATNHAIWEGGLVTLYYGA